MRRLLYSWTATVLALGLVACQSPLRPTEAPLGSFHVLATSPQGLVDPSKTTLPTLPAFHYTVDLTGTATLSFTNLTNLTEPFVAPVGPYTLQVTLLNAAGKVIGLSAPTAITVQVDSTKNSFPVSVVPQSTGTGQIAMVYSWPAVGDDGNVLVDQGLLSMTDLKDGSAVDLSSLSTLNVGMQTATVMGTLPSGTYLLTLSLSKKVGGVFYFHPAVCEVVRIYDNLTSGRTFALTTADLQSRPDAPVSILSSFDGTNFHVSWAVDPGTQSGFSVYRNGVLWSTLAAAATTFDAPGTPSGPNEVIEVAAFNAFGESDRVTSTVVIPQLQPVTSYVLKVGTSLTTGAGTTSLDLSWSNPTSDSVALYRATAVGGPYTLVTTSTQSTFIDSEAFGLSPGTTYYYALATQGGYLFGLPTTTLYSSLGVAAPFEHINPVPGVVSGTTLAWDAATSSGVPVVGVPYLVPDTSQLPPLTAPDYWLGPELPAVALLAGGYTYWAWGSTAENDYAMIIAAFDSLGQIYTGQYFNSAMRYVSSLAMSGANLVVTWGDGTNLVPWSSLDWFQPATYAVTVDFQVPTSPVIALDTGGAANGITLDGTQGSTETLTIDPLLSSLPGYSLVGWTIDGADQYPDTTAFAIDGNGVLTVDPQLLDSTTHEIVVWITDGAHIYSANFNIVVARFTVPK